MTVHELKTWSEGFNAIWYGSKRHEVRRNDRNFQAGDTVILREFQVGEPNAADEEAREDRYLGRAIVAKIGHVTQPGKFGLPDDLCVFTIEVILKAESLTPAK